MSQSTVIFAALFGAFIVYVTTRGQLPAYMGILFGSANNPKQSGGSDLVGTALDVLGDFI